MHRRAASVPPPIETETSSDEDMEQGMERRELVPVACRTPEPPIAPPYTNSEVCISKSESQNSFMSLMDVSIICIIHSTGMKLD